MTKSHDQRPNEGVVREHDQQIIDRYLDAIWVEKGLSKSTLSSYAQALTLFARW